MAFEYHLPDLAEGMIEAEVVSWKVAVGDSVAMDQAVVEILTDKATMEIPSPAAGTLTKINYNAGETCAVGAVLFVIGDEAELQPPAPEAERVTSAGPTAVRPPAAAAAMGHSPEFIDATGDRARVLATPATRRLARLLHVDLSKVTPSGRRGRVTTHDVQAFADSAQRPVDSGRRDRHAAETLVPSGSSAVVVQHGPPPVPSQAGAPALEDRIPFRGVRKLIAENMSRSMFTATHFTYVEEVDVTELVALRNQAKHKAGERGIKLTYLPFIMKAVVTGLRKWPALNASLDEAAQEIVRKRYYHVGVAAQGPSGLMVSVVRNADQLSIMGLAAEVARLSEAVQAGTATRSELTGSTFTISSLGKLGGLHATPIINFPEVGILGVHKIEQRAAVVDGKVVPRWRMNLSVSLDHRLVDGWDGAMFLQEIKTLLEDPTLMFMEMV